MLRYVTPGFVLAVIVLIYIYRKVSKKLDDSDKGPPLFCRSYIWMYVALILIFCGIIYSMFRSVLLLTSYLDPAATEQFVRDRMASEHEGDLLSNWKEEASLEDWDALRLFSMSSPLWVFLTLVVCILHTWMHVSEVKKELDKGAKMTSPSIDLHHKTVQILALPLVYGLMSLEGVIRMWGVTINHVSESHHYTGWKMRKEFHTQAFDAAFMVGDIYEARALLVFGIIVMAVLKQHLEATIGDAKSEVVKYGVNAASGSAFARLTDYITNMAFGMKGLTLLGIKFFCITCLFQATWTLTRIALGYFNFMEDLFGTGESGQGKDPGFFQTKKMGMASHWFFYGAGFVASFAAIGNLVEVEKSFHATLHDFGPILKFMGTKILVTIAFVQQIATGACPPFCTWSDTRANLFYASLLCLECFLISIMHWFAWPPTEGWYMHRGSGSYVELEVG